MTRCRSCHYEAVHLANKHADKKLKSLYRVLKKRRTKGKEMIQKSNNKKVPSHKHRWRLSGYNMRMIRFRCSCGQTISRDVTPKEKKKLEKHMKETDKHIMKLHKLWHKIKKLIIVPNEMRKSPNHSLFTKEGYDLMCYMKKLQKTNPELVSARCDDRLFMNSDLWFIPHEADGEFMGVTMLVVPQCNNEPLQMFLYPRHIKSIMKALKQFANKKDTYKAPKLDIKYTPEV